MKSVAIYVAEGSPLAVNQQAAMTRYADAMGWSTVMVASGDAERLFDGLATRSFDLVLCWRTTDLRDAGTLITRLSAHGIDLLPLAQSCAALSE